MEHAAVYTYIESALKAILTDAAKYKDKLGSHPGKAETWASRLLARGPDYYRAHIPGSVF